jgi:hypothetical protein
VELPADLPVTDAEVSLFAAMLGDVINRILDAQ